MRLKENWQGIPVWLEFQWRFHKVDVFWAFQNYHRLKTWNGYYLHKRRRYKDKLYVWQDIQSTMKSCSGTVQSCSEMRMERSCSLLGPRTEVCVVWNSFCIRMTLIFLLTVVWCSCGSFQKLKHHRFLARDQRWGICKNLSNSKEYNTFVIIFIQLANLIPKNLIFMMWMFLWLVAPRRPAKTWDTVELLNARDIEKNPLSGIYDCVFQNLSQKTHLNILWAALNFVCVLR